MPRKKKTEDLEDDIFLEDEDTGGEERFPEEEIPEPEIVEDEFTEDDEYLKAEKLKKSDLTDEEMNAASEILNFVTSFISKETKIIPQNPDEKLDLLSTGIRILDNHIGGGYFPGFSQLIGISSAGKSSLAIKAMSAAQRKFKGRAICIYIDTECITTKARLMDLGVINPSIEPYNEEITVEKVFKIVETVCAMKKSNPEMSDIPVVIVWDSIANTTIEKAFEIDDPDKIPAAVAKFITHFIKRYLSSMVRNKIYMVCINQLRDAIDIGPVKKASSLKKLQNNIPGGHALKHNTSQLLLLKHKQDYNLYGFNGSINEITTLKCKGFEQYLTIPMVFSYKYGYSDFYTSFEFLKNCKRIQTGTYCKMDGYDGAGFRMKDAMRKYIEEEDFKKAFDEVLEDVIQTEIIEKHRLVSFDS